jgi:hypothetical protein
VVDGFYGVRGINATQHTKGTLKAHSIVVKEKQFATIGVTGNLNQTLTIGRLP